MPVLNQVNAPDAYDGKSAILQNCYGARGGWFSITNNPVYVQLQYPKTSQQQGEEDWTTEVLLGTGAFATVPAWCIGMQFRNSIPGSAGTITAQIAVGDEPPLSISAIGTVITSGKSPTQTILTTTSISPYSTPANCVAILVECIGGGGGGGGAPGTPAGAVGLGGSGGGGAYSSLLIVSPAASYVFSVGIGGAGGGAIAGSAGGDTSFGSTPNVLAKGGLGGTITAGAVAPPAAIGGAGGGSAGSGVGSVKISGENGHAVWSSSATVVIAGSGGTGAGLSGAGGSEIILLSGGGSNGLNGSPPGGGGSAAGNAQSQAPGRTGGTGGAGLIIITEYY